MPKSASNARPYNRSEKNEVKKNKRAISRAKKSGAYPGDSAYESVGPGRMYNSGAAASQVRRTMAMIADRALAKKIKGKRGRK